MYKQKNMSIIGMEQMFDWIRKEWNENLSKIGNIVYNLFIRGNK